MDQKYTCLICEKTWRSGEIMVICPICRRKPIKIKNGVDVREVMKKLKGRDAKKITREFKESEKKYKTN